MKIHAIKTCLLLCAATLTISGCDSRTHMNMKTSNPQASAATNQPVVGPTGQAIDPTKKKVIVVSTPSQPVNRKLELSKLKTEHAKKGKQLTALISSYSQNMNNSAEKNKIASEMAKNLEVYKRQSLELYKAQQSAAKTNQPK